MEDWTDYTDISDLVRCSTPTDLAETEDIRTATARDDVYGMLRDILDM